MVTKDILIFRKLFSNKMTSFPENMENKYTFKERKLSSPKVLKHKYIYHI